MISNKCTEVLDKTKNFPPVYGDRLANHLPMVLISLDKIGANKDQLQDFTDNYIKRFSKEKITANYLDKYNKEICIVTKVIDSIGIDKTISQYIDRLLDGVTASAFHCLIRLSYAVESEVQYEIIKALAFWVIEYEPISLSKINTQDPLDIIFSKVEEIRNTHTFTEGIIIDKILDANNRDVLDDLKVQPINIDLDLVSTTCIDLFYRTNNFTVLHAVTGCHALRLLLPYCSKKKNFLRNFFQGVIYAFITTDCEVIFKKNIDIKGLTWESLFSKVKSSKNDHQIKLMYSLYSEYKHYKNTDYLKVAKIISEYDWRVNFM